MEESGGTGRERGKTSRENQQAVIRVTGISVTSLFDLFDHTIELNLQDRTTIIHGPNGFGKTIILKMLDGLFNDQYKVLRKTPFRTFEVKFDSGEILTVNKAARSAYDRQDSLLDDQDLGWEANEWDRQQVEDITVSLSSPWANAVDPFIIEDPYVSKHTTAALTKFERVIPEIELIGPRQWLHIPTGDVLSYGDVLERFGPFLPGTAERQPRWWTDLNKRIDIQLIETQRLLNLRASDRALRTYSRREPRWVPAVEEYSSELAQIIQDKLAQSAALSQSLDRSFPIRLVEQTEHPNLTETELRAKLDNLENKRNQLKEVGLLDGEEDIAFMPKAETIPNIKDVLAVYVQDVERKLSVYDEIAEKLALFREIINQRFLYKDVVISKEDGFTFFGWRGQPLPLDALSSGEQHEVVLLYHLLFKVSPEALVLIDEPELSLHVAWQKQFLKDLQRIATLASFDVLVATHSPQVIHDRWDLAVELQAPTALAPERQ